MLDGWCGMDGLCGWAMVRHTAFRFALHFSLGAGVALLCLTAWSELSARGWLWRLRGLSFFTLPALAAVLVIFIREPWDVAHGDPALKSMTDLASRCLGVGVAEIGLYRLEPRLGAAREAIDEQRRGMESRRSPTPPGG